MTSKLSQQELRTAVAIVASALDGFDAKFGICGGAGVSLITEHYHIRPRQTADIDLIIQPDKNRDISAEKVSKKLIKAYPQQFATVSQYGVSTPAVRLQRNGQEILVEVEIFDVEAWPNRPQYNLNNPQNARITLNVSGKPVYVLSPAWLLREKILAQKQREGSKKEETDIADIETLVQIAGDKDLVIEGEDLVEALKELLQKRPDLKADLERVIKCPELLGS
ncbi:MAG: hypothetical protein M1830_007991 [Pleopsidium flavum]|nr:MAG: hypothetical protein M1830_007991 [Pleopsidium flavum]